MKLSKAVNTLPYDHGNQINETLINMCEMATII